MEEHFTRFMRNKYVGKLFAKKVRRARRQLEGRHLLKILMDNTLLNLHNFSDDTQPHSIIIIIIHSNYFPNSDWLKADT